LWAAKLSRSTPIANVTASRFRERSARARPRAFAVGLLDDVTQMDANAEFDAALGRHSGVALDHAVLDFDRTTHRVDDAAKLDEAGVSSGRYIGPSSQTGEPAAA
jgi:hypothetical protein